jgi:hypothetical protein
MCQDRNQPLETVLLDRETASCFTRLLSADDAARHAAEMAAGAIGMRSRDTVGPMS